MGSRFLPDYIAQPAAEVFLIYEQGKQRTQRAEEVVMPEIEKLKPLIAKRVFEEMKKAGMRGDKKALQKYHAEKSIEIVCFRPILPPFRGSKHIFI